MSTNFPKLPDTPPTIHYIPNFITQAEETHILDKIYSAPKPKWTHLSNRRLQDYGGIPHKTGLIPEKLPEWLDKYMKRIDELQIAPPVNHVLINEYKPGQGIMPHTDGPIFTPVITTVTCGSHGVLEFTEPEKRAKTFNVLLERRSLVVIKDEMYGYLHSISELEEDTIVESCANLRLCGDSYKLGQKLARGTRVSLTIRNVPVVRNVKLFRLN